MRDPQSPEAAFAPGKRRKFEPKQAAPNGADHDPPKPDLPFVFHAALVENESAIPRRRWVGGAGAFPRPKVACISGAPGTHKTTVALSVAIMLAIGRAWAGLIAPEAPCRVLIACIEDDIDEVRRRVHAFVKANCDLPHERALIRDNLRIIDLSEEVPLYEVSAEGRTMARPAVGRLQASILAHRAELVVLDPLIELHTGEETNNSVMVSVLRQPRAIAAESDCVILVLHHETKAGDGAPLQRLRGAGSIGGSIRRHWSMRAMTQDEAADMNIADDLRDLYVKIEGGKNQYGRLRSTGWFVVEERELANGDGTHLLAPWNPAPFDVTPEVRVAALRVLREGVEGEPCSMSNNAKACLGTALAMVGIPRRQAKKVLAALKASDGVEERAWIGRDSKPFKRLWAPGTTLAGWKP